MEFGNCKVCRKYRMLVHENACIEHAELPNLSVRMSFMNDEYNPEDVYNFSEIVVEDPRIVRRNGVDQKVGIVLSDMEIIIKDDGGDAVEKFEYDGSEDIREKTESAVDWVVRNYS